MLGRARLFFQKRHIIEVDCPALSRFASVDSHIDLIPALYNHSEKAYLHSSPEYGMKQLLAEGIGDIYQLSHVFRDGESGRKHNPEFMMAEWYRCGITFQAMIEETIDFIRLFVGDLSFNLEKAVQDDKVMKDFELESLSMGVDHSQKVKATPIESDYSSKDCVNLSSSTAISRFKQMTYREVFLNYAGIDYLKSSEEDILSCLKENGVEAYPDVISEGKDALLNLLLGTVIEPKLGGESLFVLSHYPSSQAALANTVMHGDEAVAERFEVYFKGIELANGYHELTDAVEQRKRLIEANKHRKEMGKEELPIDENFLKALSKGIPRCCGVAVGFDRLMMLRHHADHIGDVIPFSWILHN